MVGRVTMVYDGQEVNNLTRDETVRAILRAYGLASNDESMLAAMKEAFRCGWLRGEEYVINMNK